MRTSGIINFSVTVILPLMLLVLLALPSEAEISCSDVVKYLQPCVTYLRNGTGNPPSSCCTGVSALAAAVSSSASDRKAACQCIKSAAAKINPIKQNAQTIPTYCQISSPVSISANVDCSKVT